MLVVLVLGVLAWQRPWAGAGDDRAEVPFPADARALLVEQVQALGAATTRDDLEQAAGEGETARTFAQEVWQALDVLDVEDVSFRYVSGGDAADRPDGSTLVVADVTWRPGADSPFAVADDPDAALEARVGLRMAPRPDGTFSVEDVEAAGGRVPPWLLGDVASTPDGEVRVVTIDGGVPGLDALASARRADTAVRDVVADADGRLVVVAPATRAQAALLLGERPDDLGALAGVATTIDGEGDSAPVVVLEPTAFGSMDERGRQVLITHEAAHLLTGVVGSGTTPWVAEGFADYAALRDDDAPLAVSAGQALAAVRADGAPAELPDAEAFQGAGTHGSGAVYEGAWLIFRMLAEQVGPERVVAFYEAVTGGDDVDAAARQHLGLDVEQITRRWQDYLEKSASTVS